MGQIIITLNAGSSSIKFGVFERGGETPRELARGGFDGLGATPRFRASDAAGGELAHEDWTGGDGPTTLNQALEHLIGWLDDRYHDGEVAAVGHRVVHGGPDLDRPLVVDDTVRAQLTAFVPLAPLHQPYNLDGIDAAREAFPHAPQIACFDTAFHRAHPWVNDTFAIPRELYAEGIRRYGFHGLSYEYICQELARIAPYYASGRVIAAHLGNGASMCAIRNGQSIGSTMGFTALDGLPMGTRCGQIDPGVVLYLILEKGISPEAVQDMLYKQSGLKGLSGISHDMRVLEASTDPAAHQAIDYFVFRARRDIGAMAAVLGGLDAVVFAGGIGENASRIRARICSGFEWLGIELDEDANRRQATVISSDRSRCRVFIIRTNEEAAIARHADGLLGSPVLY